MIAILNSIGGRRHEMSGNVDSVIFKSCLVENVGVKVEIASLSQAVQQLLSLPFLRPPSWISGFRLHVTVSAVAPLDSSTSKIGEPLEFRSYAPQNSRYLVSVATISSSFASVK